MWEIIIAGAAAVKIPGLLESAVRSVGERLLGPYLDRLAQPVKDRTLQRSRVALAIADLAAKKVTENPDLFREEVNHLLKTNGARTEHIEATFVKSLNYLAAGTSKEAQVAESTPPSDDWLNRWSRYVEDASSEELQDAFARILAGEIKQKGTFSIGTLRVVSEMSMETALDFQALWAETIEDYAVKYRNYERGEGWERLSRLREAGLISFSDPSIHKPSGSRWIFGNGPMLIVEIDPNIPSEVPIIKMTRLGMELGTILPPPDRLGNLRRLAAECPNKRGWQQAVLWHGTHQEKIWKASTGH
ncbi:DUF2806 domain-containing protein [Achromobacter dolens]|uniref:DUF2806 domain-containing protein n=1 Tax=Achromobacter dolens TaxID=1287738 RepID=UPI00119FCF53|nr:DUF2806 domain-containing protein [Achromobacter dolens]